MCRAQCPSQQRRGADALQQREPCIGQPTPLSGVMPVNWARLLSFTQAVLRNIVRWGGLVHETLGSDGRTRERANSLLDTRNLYFERILGRKHVKLIRMQFYEPKNNGLSFSLCIRDSMLFFLLFTSRRVVANVATNVACFFVYFLWVIFLGLQNSTDCRNYSVVFFSLSKQ